MTKLSSFLVFIFGLFVMVAVVVIFSQRYFFPPPPAPPEEKVILPECNLPTLDLGTREQFLAQLDRLFGEGGLESVRQFVEKELVPGRRVRVAGATPADPVREMRIIDRELRRCDADGVAPMDKPPVLARVSASLRIGEEGLMESWLRLEPQDSFVVIVWWTGGIK